MVAVQTQNEKLSAHNRSLKEQLSELAASVDSTNAAIRESHLSQDAAVARSDAVLRHFSTVLVGFAKDFPLAEDVIDGLMASDTEVFGASMRRYA
jgi:cell division septum initiation protein DivIVA